MTTAITRFIKFYNNLSTFHYLNILLNVFVLLILLVSDIQQYSFTFFLILKYLYLIYGVTLFVLICIRLDVEMNNKITIFKRKLSEITLYFLGISRYLISYFLLSPRVEEYLPYFLRKHLKSLAFTLVFGFLYNQLHNMLFRTLWVEYYLYFKCGAKAYEIVLKISTIFIILITYIPLAIIIYCLSADNDEENEENITKFNTPINIEL